MPPRPQPTPSTPSNNTNTPAPGSSGISLDQMREVQNQYRQNHVPSYPNTSNDIEQQINSMPNSEKLSAGERWLYKTLPSVGESKWGKVLMNLAESPFGKVLSFLDVGAEALERTAGLLPQIGQMAEDGDWDWKNAWAAGTLMWDTTNMPRLERDENGKLRFQIDSDLPGSMALNEVRNRLKNGEKIQDIKAAYYQNLGALSIRAQLNDTWGHFLGDPLNWALGAVKPIQKAAALKHLALTGKVEIEAVQAAEQAARLAGNLEDANRYADLIKSAQATGKALTKTDRFIIGLMGGTPWLQDASKLSPAQKVFNKLNPFALTPQARASELLDVVAANVGEYVVRPNWNKDPEEAIKMLSGIYRGAVGDEWGHAAFTIQGRTMQSFVANTDVIGKTLISEWRQLSKERAIFEAIATTLGKDITQVWRHAGKDADNLLQLVIKQSQAMGDNLLSSEIKAGNLTAETLGAYARNVTSEAGLHNEAFYAKLLVAVQDSAMQQAITRFGITEKGVFTKWADALKAWETIPFIKANPANAIRNVINNDMTLIGRGLMGTMTPGQIKNFWKGKYVPPQFSRAFGIGAIDEFDGSSAAQRLSEALTGKRGLADRVKEAAGAFAKKTGLDSKFSPSSFSQRAEAAASQRATTVAWMEFHQKYWNAKTGFTSFSKHADNALLDAIEAEHPGLAAMLDDLAASAGADSEKFAKLMQEGIENNPTSVLRQASDKLGYDFQDVIGSETIEIITQGLPDAIKKGNVRNFIQGIKTQMENHLDDMFMKHVEELPGIVQAQVQAGGQQQYYRIFAKATDEMWGSHTEHAFRMSTLNDTLREARVAKDYKKANAIWNKILTDSDKHFARMWSKFDAYQAGLERGAKAAGIPYPDEVRKAFRDIKSGWNNFFTHRNKVMQEFFDARLSGKEYKTGFDQIQAELNGMYRKMVAEEDRLSSEIDDVVAMGIGDPQMRQSYVNYRDTVAQLKGEDKARVIEFYETLQNTSATDSPQLWQAFWQERMGNLERIRQIDSFGSAMLQGDVNAAKTFMGQAGDVATVAPTEGKFSVVDLFNKAGVPTATKTGARNNRRILSTVKKYTGQEFKTIDEIPEDVARAALDARAAAQPAAQKSQAFIPDAEKMFPDPMPLETGLNQLNYGRGYAVLDAIEEAGVEAVGKATTNFGNLSPEVQKAIAKWQTSVNSDMSAFRSGAVQYSLFRRDSALLNYNRRTNFDTWLGNAAPFAFWTTHSVFNWAVHSIDRTGMVTNYFRMKQVFDSAGLKGKDMPSRLKGHIRLNLPFVPEWMGDTFLNPLRIALPFDSFMAPWEQSAQSNMQLEGRTQRTLDTMLDSGEITQQEYQDALTTKTGDVYEIATARAEEGGDSYDAMDFVQMSMSPHAPLMWAFNAARGQKSEIGAFTPMTRTVKNFAAVLGVDDWSNSPYNIEARVRKSMGLNAYDKWDDYRVSRSISNMVGDGTLSPEQAASAMETASLVELGKISSAEAFEGNEFYAEAVRRSNIEYAGGTPGAILGMLGIPIKSYPTGEEHQRELNEQFGQAYDKYNEANKNLDKFLAGREPTDELVQEWERRNPSLARDSEALTKFFDENPEFETRLSLFKSPEERLKNFMVDNMWARWNELPTLTRKEMQEQLGSAFSDKFLSSETRNYDGISMEQMQIWLKLTGGKQVGFLTATDEALVELNELRLTDPETAERVDIFYQRRNFDHDGWYELQSKYYALPEGQERKKFTKENPELKEYWDFRRRFMENNPDLVKYLTDDPKQLAKAEKAERSTASIPTANEIRTLLSPSMTNLLVEYEQEGQNLPIVVRQNLNILGQQYGLSGQQVLNILTAGQP